MKNLKIEAESLKDKLKKIKIIILDVDGVLTNAQVYYQGEEIGFNRYFNVYDGYGMKLLMEAGLKVGVISGGDSVGLRKRVEQLKLNFSYLGDENKKNAFLDIKNKYQVEFDEMFYMGDELFDLPLLRKAGFSATVPTACDEVLTQVDYVTEKKGGEGAVREVIEMIRYVQNIHPVLEEI